MPSLKYLKVKSYLEAVAVKAESAMRMPTVRELMNQFNVSLATVNRALSALENDGVIVRRQGSGIVAAGKHRTVARLQGKAAGVRNLLFAYNDIRMKAPGRWCTRSRTIPGFRAVIWSTAKSIRTPRPNR